MSLPRSKPLIVVTVVGIAILLIAIVSALTGGRGVGQSPEPGVTATPNPAKDQALNAILALDAKIDEVTRTNENLLDEIDSERRYKSRLEERLGKTDGAIGSLRDELRRYTTNNRSRPQTSPLPSNAKGTVEADPDDLISYEDRLAGLVNSEKQETASQEDDKSTAPSGAVDTGKSVFDVYNNRLGAKKNGGLPLGNYTWHQPQNRPDMLDPKLANKNNKRTNSNSKEEDQKIPKYTIPPNATSFRGVALTALVGRIPINGKTPDPYRAKIIISKENLAANGYYFDGVEGMIVSGWAKGDWALSCVSVDIDSYLFVFEDGRIVAKEPDFTSGGGLQDRIGHIAMTNGFPCIDGVFHTNAPSYLTQITALNLFAIAGEAYSEAAQTQEDLPLGGQRSTVNDTGDYVLGETVAGSVDESVRWVEERAQNSFDAVISKPGTRLDVHFDKAIEIDYDPNGRKVSYEKYSPYSVDID